MLRILLIAAALLLSTGPSPASPRHPTPAQGKDINRYVYAAPRCANGEDNDETKKQCDEADRLGKKLEAQGFCRYGKGGIGRAGGKYFYPGIDSSGAHSGWARHCYVIQELGTH